jgi:hypothetical protein
MSFLGLRSCKFLVEPNSGYLNTRDEKSRLEHVTECNLNFAAR